MSIRKELLEKFERAKEEQLKYQGQLSYNQAAREKIVSELKKLLDNNDYQDFHSTIERAIYCSEDKEAIAEILEGLEAVKARQEQRLEMLLK